MQERLPLVETGPFTGGFSLVLDPDGEFVEEDYDITYICTARTLAMQGYLTGVSKWGPYVFSREYYTVEGLVERCNCMVVGASTVAKLTMLVNAVD